MQKELEEFEWMVIFHADLVHISYSSKEKLKLGSMGVDFIREISPAVLGCTLGLGTSTLVRRIWLGGPEHRAQ